MSASPSEHRATFLGVEKNVAVMLAVFLVLGMGEELWARFLPKYLVLLGATGWVVAGYGTLRDLLEALYPYPGGWVTDRLGRRAALTLFALLAIGGYLLYALAPSWPWILVATLFAMAWGSLTLPAIFAILGDHLPTERRAVAFGIQAILKRVPIILAPPLGGLLIVELGLASGVRVGLAVTIVLALGGIVLLRRGYVEKPLPPPDGERIGSLWRAMDPGLKRLLVADCLARWAEGIPKVFVIFYVIDVLHRGAVEFGTLTSVQMIAATLVYLPVARMADRLNRRPFVLLTFGFFALFPLVLAAASGTVGLIVAFVVAGLRETGEPARKALIVDLADERARGRAVGLYYLIRGLVAFPASLVGGWLWLIGPRTMLVTAFCVGVVGCAVYATWGPKDPKLIPERSHA